MEKNALPELQRLLADVTSSARAAGGENTADTARVEAAQKLGCEIATGATFTKLLAAIEAEIAEQNMRTDG